MLQYDSEMIRTVHPPPLPQNLSLQIPNTSSPMLVLAHAQAVLQVRFISSLGESAMPTTPCREFA